MTTHCKLRTRKQFAMLAMFVAVMVITVYYLMVSSAHPIITTPTSFPKVVFHRQRELLHSDEDLPTLYIITPTYRRPEQIPELTRLGQTLMHVPKLHWLVADDSTSSNKQVVDYLKSTGMSFTYLLTPMPSQYANRWFGPLPKGVANRNGAMKWLRCHATKGVMYMADDDNTYDMRIFHEIRHTKKVSMFPVGLVTEVGLSTPVLRNGQWVGWYDGWTSDRVFPVDMAGFAISIPFLLSVPEAEMPYIPGYEETGFLNSLHISINDIEFLAGNCTKIYVWHTRTERNKPGAKQILDKKYDGTNLRHLQEVMIMK